MKLIWSEESWDDYLYWQETDKRIVKKINELIKDTRRTPFEGKGKPEPVTSKDLEQQVKNGQSISLMELVGAIRREERKKKPSVIQKLKEWTGHERNKTAPKRDKEREI